ncbi:MAG: hypothetical protein HRJ53_22025, partial [Acidobacteria bacterium Pan2503]|nr:hypothetical protein [Candidatus Acidoferrum panamensis]
MPPPAPATNTGTPLDPGSTNPRFAMPETRFSRDEWLEMRDNAVREGNIDASKYFQDMADRAGPPKPSAGERARQSDYDRMLADAAASDPDWMTRALQGGFETPLTVASSVPATIASGVAGVGKAGYNVLSRALGGNPQDAAEAVKWVQ